MSAQAWRAIANQWRESERFHASQRDFAQRCAHEADRRAEAAEKTERDAQGSLDEEAQRA